MTVGVFTGTMTHPARRSTHIHNDEQPMQSLDAGNRPGLFVVPLLILATVSRGVVTAGIARSPRTSYADRAPEVPVSPSTRHLVAAFVFALALSTVAVAQQAPAAGTFTVPSGWRLETEDSKVILSAPRDEALVYLMIFSDNRESWQVVDDYVYNVAQDRAKKVKIVSKDIFKRNGKEYTRVVLSVRRKDGSTYSQNAFGIPVEGGNLVMLAVAHESMLANYAPELTLILYSVLPKEAIARQEPQPFPVDRTDVGMKLMVAASWTVEPGSMGEHSRVPYLKITRDNALLSLSSKQDPRTSKDYLAEVEKNTREQSKTYEKLSEQLQTVAGVAGTRLELRTVNKQGIPVRRWIVVLSRNGRHYVIAAGAPESSFDQYIADFNAMIATVAFTD